MEQGITSPFLEPSLLSVHPAPHPTQFLLDPPPPMPTRNCCCSGSDWTFLNTLGPRHDAYTQVSCRSSVLLGLCILTKVRDCVLFLPVTPCKAWHSAWLCQGLANMPYSFPEAGDSYTPSTHPLTGAFTQYLLSTYTTPHQVNVNPVLH